MSSKKLSDKEINETLNADLSDLSDFCESEDDDDVDRDKDYIPSSSCNEESDVEVVPSSSAIVDQIICITVPPPSACDNSQEMLDNLVTDRQSSRSAKPSTSRSANIPSPDFSSGTSTSRSSNVLLPSEAVYESIWQSVEGERTTFPDVVLGNTGVPPDIYAKLHQKGPIDCFNHLLDDEIIGLLVIETNRFAAQTLSETSLPNARVKKWIETNAVEMRKFIGILFWMGLVSLRHLRDYWSNDPIYKNGISEVMNRNRFELLLSMFHLCNNEEQTPMSDRVFKLQKFLILLQRKYQTSYIPEEESCIDESNVPFRGRLLFRQYIPNKRHKYGIKLFKLCVGGGYTWNFKVYTGKEKVDETAVSEKIVMELFSELLDHGRTLYTDNWYTSVKLAQRMVERKTHLVGTLRKNRRGNPPDVVQAKLKRGEQKAQQNQEKVVVLKWQDKRDVLMLSTKHGDTMVTKVNRGKEITKPEMVFDYNIGKSYVDISDQLSAYSPYLRRTVKWYKRLAFHLITATTVVNALHLYNKINNKKMPIKKFKEELVRSLVLGQSDKPASEEEEQPADMSVVSEQPQTPQIPTVTIKHILKEAEGPKRKTRKRCSVCYKKMAAERGTPYARKTAKMINTFCIKCNIPICIKCFEQHSA